MRLSPRTSLFNLGVLAALQLVDAAAVCWLLPYSAETRVLLCVMLLSLGLALAAVATIRPRRAAAPAPTGDFRHQLRNALNSIIGFAELIEGQLLGPIGVAKYRDYAGYIRESGNNLLGLVEE